ncbi:MAG: MATE family efflux transporter [Candidatus Woesearchaeota archaeon]
MVKSRLKEFINSPYKSLFAISLPIMAAGIVETLYNIVDTVYVGRLGPEALAAITFSWPIFFFLVSVSIGLNAGISSRLSRYIGEKNHKQARNTMMHGLILSILLGILITICGLLSVKSLFIVSGATGAVLEMATEYIFLLLLGTVFLLVSYAITGIFSAQGDTKTAMKIDISSLALNIILAPIFMFVLHMGIRGAALATVVAYLFALILCVYYVRKTKYLRFSMKYFKFSKVILKDIVMIGFFSSVMMIIISCTAIFLNRVMITFGTNNVAALGMIGRLESLVYLPVYGLSVGAMTLAGMFYGAKRYDILKKTTFKAVQIAVLISGFVSLIIFIFPEFFMRWFTNDPLVIAAAVPYVRLDVIALPFIAITMILSRSMQAMGFGFPGLLIALIRSLFIAVPLAYIFVFFLHFGYLSIAVAMIIASVFSAIINIIWFKRLVDKKA